MLTIEDCLEKLDDSWYNTKRKVEDQSNWDHRFITDVAMHVRDGKAVSTEQGKIILKLITRYRDKLISEGVSESDLSYLISSPQYRRPPYTSTIVAREVRWMGNSKLAFRCKYNATITEDIKRLKGTNHFLDSAHPWFHRDTKLWIVDVNSGNLERVMDVIKRHGFSFDDDVEHFFLNAMNSIGQHSRAEVCGNQLVIDIKDDDFLNAWANCTAGMNH